jgi:hypothetical protein
MMRAIVFARDCGSFPISETGLTPFAAGARHAHVRSRAEEYIHDHVAEFAQPQIF